jgi:hypothetical protein
MGGANYQDETDLGNLEGRRPLVLEDIKADATHFVNVGVVDLGHKIHERRRHRVVRRQKQLKLERATLVRRIHCRKKKKKRGQIKEACELVPIVLAGSKCIPRRRTTRTRAGGQRQLH